MEWSRNRQPIRTSAALFSQAERACGCAATRQDPHDPGLSTVASPVRIVGKEDLPDRFPGCGPMGGIQTALAVTESEANLIVAVDLPLLEPAFLKWFRDRIIQSANPVVARRIGRAFPLCLGIHRSIAPEVSGRIAAGNLAIQRFIQESNSYILAEEEIHAAGFPRSIFHNVNTPEDWNSLA